MEPAEIAIAKASDLHFKINDAISRASLRQQAEEQGTHAEEIPSEHSADDEQVDEVADHRFPDVRKLIAIRDALVALKHQLDTWQALQKRQKTKRDEVLSEVEESRKVLVGKLREYDGTEWELVEETHIFAGEPVHRKDDLVLPPYQSPVPDVSSFGNDEHSANFHKASRAILEGNFARRASLTNRFEEEGECDELTPQEAAPHDGEKVNLGARQFSGFGVGLPNFITGVGHAVGLTAKTALVITSVIAILTFSRLDTRLRNRSAQRGSRLSIRKGMNNQDNRSSSSISIPLVLEEFCPPGKVLLVQDGIQKCFVRERVEAPFEEVVKKPDASYGYG